VAYLVTESSPPDLVEQLRTLIRTTLPDYMVPALFVILDTLPRTLNGKLDRKALPAPEHTDYRTTYVAPRTTGEEILAGIWAEVLKIERVGRNDDFFELGGNSLVAVRFFARVKKNFGISLPLSTLFQATTIRSLVDVMRNHGYVDTAAKTFVTLNDHESQVEVQSSNAILTTQTQNAQSDSNNMAPLLIRTGKGGLPLFFVHDGLGEVLLYRNLAFRLDPRHPVYGLEPEVSNGRFVHTRIVDMARAKVERIRKVQPTGPYMVAGLCAGGVIAFEIARQFEELGEQTLFVGIIDAADVAAEKRSFHDLRERIKRFLGTFRHTAGNQSDSSHILNCIVTFAKKAINFVSYAISTRLERIRNAKKLAALRKHEALSTNVTEIDFNKLLELAFQEHVTQGVFHGEDIVLFRATQNMGIAGDQPFREVFSDPFLGWQKRVREPIKAIDVSGGHSSALQEPHVEMLAKEMQICINSALKKHQQTASM
jgi:thioesterase domain-containing protein/acyl carrier protein